MKLFKFTSISILILVLTVFAFIGSSCSKGEMKMQSYNSPELQVGDKTTCPVMKTVFTVKEDSVFATVDGKKYYVCCPGCNGKIEAEPDKYLKDAEEESHEDSDEGSHEGHDHSGHDH